MWTVSQVSRMTGVPVSDIQRICNRNDDAFIFSPKVSQPGKRYFEEEDVLKILLVGQYKAMGYNLMDVKRAFRSLESEGSSLEEIAEAQLEELKEHRRLLDSQIAQAENLQFAFKADDLQEATTRLLVADIIELVVEASEDCVGEVLGENDVALFRNEFIKSFGVAPEDLKGSFLSTGCLPDGLSACNGQRLTEGSLLESVSLCQQLLDEKEAPGSIRTQRLVESLIDSLIDPNAERDNVTKKTIGLLLLAVFERPRAELIVELLISRGAFEFLKSAVVIYLSRLVGLEERSSDEY